MVEPEELPYWNRFTKKVISPAGHELARVVQMHPNSARSSWIVYCKTPAAVRSWAGHAEHVEMWARTTA
eukprot:7648874-Lingulodinium_polyedra.AAC.1